MNKKNMLSLAVVVAAGVFGYVGIPHITHVAETPYPTVFAAAAIMGVAGCITMFYLLTAIRGFRSSGKLAYIIIAFGVLCYALAQVEQVAVAIIFIYFPNAPIGDIARNVLFIAPFLLSALGLYIGMRRLRRLIEVQSIGSSVPLLVITMIVLVIGVLLLPLPEMDQRTEILSKVVGCVSAIVASLTFAAALMAQNIKNVASVTFQKSLSSLSWALVVLTLASLQEIVFKLTHLVTSSYVANALDILPFVLTGLIFMWSGQALTSATTKRLPDNATYIDAVVYASSLASNPKAIDTILDELRSITAMLPQGAKLDAPQQDRLLRVYLRIEEYLATKEPIRNVTRQALRARLTPEFQHALVNFESKG